ncbi:hypothetical protein [Sphingomonas sp. PB1R3]|uniref:hypothetical protein n=1 Tax=Sphingomonas flavida TaxID=3096154 RepID=UPI002FCA33B1
MAAGWLRGIAAAALIGTASWAGAADNAVEHGTGRFPAMLEERADLPDHVVYRPRDMAALGRAKLGIYVFGNGGCGSDGTASRNHLLEIASHGYLVIASGTIPKPADVKTKASPPGGGLQVATATHLLSDAIDWAVRENGRADSPFRDRIATDEIAASGWSCGGLQALAVAVEPRVKTSVIMNSGFFPAGANPIPGIVSDKALLKRLHGSTLYVLGGTSDIAHGNGTDDFGRITHIPAALVNIPVGHGGTYMLPHGGVAAEVVTAWLDWQLKGDAKARQRFVGADCGYCRDPRLTLDRNALLQKR